MSQLYTNSCEFHINDVLSRLKLAMHHFSLSTIDQFDKFDKDKNFTLSKQEFGQCLISIDPTLTAYDINYAFNRFDTDKSGTIGYLEFCAQIDQTQLPPGTNYLTQEQLKQQQQDVKRQKREQLKQEMINIKSKCNAEVVILKLKEAILFYEKDITEIFKKYDTSPDNNLDYDEFTNFIISLEPNLLFVDILTAFTLFDKDGNNNINLEEFKELLEI